MIQVHCTALDGRWQRTAPHRDRTLKVCKGRKKLLMAPAQAPLGRRVAPDWPARGSRNRRGRDAHQACTNTHWSVWLVRRVLSTGPGPGPRTRLRIATVSLHGRRSRLLARGGRCGSSFMYLRLHGAPPDVQRLFDEPAPTHGPRNRFCFFDNTRQNHAPRDARQLVRIAGAG